MPKYIIPGAKRLVNSALNELNEICVVCETCGLKLSGLNQSVGDKEIQAGTVTVRNSVFNDFIVCRKSFDLNTQDRGSIGDLKHFGKSAVR